MTRSPAPALTAEEARTVARFDAAPVPPEVVAAGERVETVARAIAEAQGVGRTATPLTRRLAAAAIAALPPSPAEEAVKRVVEELADRQVKAVVAGSYFPDDSRERSRWVCRATGFGVAAELLRAALASPAPAPQEPEPCPACGSRTSIHDGNAHATTSMTVPAPQGEEGQR